MKRTYDIDASNGLSHQKLLVYMDKTHPREEYKEGNVVKLRKRPICGTRSGWHCWRPKVRKSDFANYGMGTVIYF